MNIAQARPRTWTPHIILFSVVLHAVILYYVAVAFNVIPPVIPRTDEPRTIQAVRIYEPPKLDDPEPLIKTKPLFRPHVPPVAPVETPVQPAPLVPTTQTDVSGPTTITIGREIGDKPAVQILPPYPPRAVAADIEGTVFLSITIMPDGSVRDVEVVKSNPRGYFESSALNAVKQWRYAPSNMIRKNVIVRMDFELK